MKLAEKTLILFEAKLIGSAPSLELLLDSAKKYFYSDSITFKELDDKSYEVHNSKGKIDGVKITKKGNRYRMEME